jgi:hypothetical protein
LGSLHANQEGKGDLKGIFRESNLLPPLGLLIESTIHFTSVDPDLPSPFTRPSSSLTRAASILHRRRPRPYLRPPDVFWVRPLSLARAVGRRRGAARATVRSCSSVTAVRQKLCKIGVTIAPTSSTSHPPPCCLEGFFL